AGATSVCQNATAPSITFTGSNGTIPYTFTYNINGEPDQTVTTVIGNSITVSAPTGTSGNFDYNLTQVQDASSTNCSKTVNETVRVTVNTLPTASIAGNADICQGETTLPQITFTGDNGAAPYTFT